MDFMLCVFSFFMHGQDCSSPVIPVDGSRALSKTCSKRVHDNGQPVFIYIYDIYDKMCPYPMITPAPVKEKQQFCYQVLL